VILIAGEGKTGISKDSIPGKRPSLRERISLFPGDLKKQKHFCAAKKPSVNSGK
jgi:hypothetical protein